MKFGLRVLSSLAGVVLITFCAYRLFSLNATTVGFAYLLFVLVVASTWGYVEAAVVSVASTLAFNFYFLPPIRTLTISSPDNWVALFTFLATSLIAGRLSALAERRAQEAIERRQDLERLYTFSRAILLISDLQGQPFPKQLTQKLAEIFGLEAALLYDRRSDEVFRGGPAEVEAMEAHLRDTARNGESFQDPTTNRVVTAIRLGSEPIAALAIQGPHMPDSVLQGIANIVAIGLERARAEDLAHQVEAARRSEQLRTTLLDTMAHEFKTPLTSIKAVTSSLLADPEQPEETRKELLAVADEEAERLKTLIDNALEMARLDSEEIDLNREPVTMAEIVHEAVVAVEPLSDGRQVEVSGDEATAEMYLDRRLVRMALKQILDNALKYSPHNAPVQIQLHAGDGLVAVDITDHGAGIPKEEEGRVFERFYRGASTKQQIPGSGLGLSIANSIVQAHGGRLSVSSHPGETTFRMTLPVEENGGAN